MRDFESQCWICPICGDDHIPGGECNAESTRMSDEVFEKWKNDPISVSAVAFMDHAKDMEVRLNRCIFALRELEPHLSGLLFDSDLILTMQFEEAIKSALVCIDATECLIERKKA